MKSMSMIQHRFDVMTHQLTSTAGFLLCQFPDRFEALNYDVPSREELEQQQIQLLEVFGITPNLMKQMLKLKLSWRELVWIYFLFWFIYIVFMTYLCISYKVLFVMLAGRNNTTTTAGRRV